MNGWKRDGHVLSCLYVVKELITLRKGDSAKKGKYVYNEVLSILSTNSCGPVVSHYFVISEINIGHL